MNPKPKTKPASIKAWIVKNLEAMGLSLLLFAFGWQCFQETADSVVLEGYIGELNEKLYYIMTSEYDEAIKDNNRYQGTAVSYVNYDSFHEANKDWYQVQESIAVLKEQGKTFYYIRIVLFIVGSCFVIVSKTSLVKST